MESLKYLEKKFNSISFIFNDEAKEFTEIVKKLDSTFNSECDFSNEDSNFLENKISQYFNEIKGVLLKLFIEKEIKSKSLIEGIKPI